MTEIHIKPLGRSQTKFSVNGKLCVIEKTNDEKRVHVKYHHKTTLKEREFFKSYLDILNPF